jgi:hypothetical protein
MSEATFVGAVVGVGMAILFISLAAIQRRLNRLSRLDAKVDALLRASGVKFNALQDVPADAGPLGTLSGTAGTKAIDRTCVDRVTTR